MTEQMENKRIAFEGLKNTRDLGGCETEDGKKIKPGCLLRGEALFAMTGADRDILLNNFRLQMVIDLRTALEAEQKPDPPLPGVKMVFNPVLDEATAGFTRENRDGDPFKSFIKHAESLRGNPQIYTKKLYHDLVLNAQAIGRYRNFLELIAEAEPEKGAVLWHCSAGKDRAGMATAFLLTALRVPRDTVIEDFTLTNEFLKAEMEYKMQRVREMGGSEETVQSAAVLSQVDPSYLTEAFRTAEEAAGSLDQYLKTRLGLSDERREILREKYLI